MGLRRIMKKSTVVGMTVGWIVIIVVMVLTVIAAFSLWAEFWIYWRA